MASTVEPWAKRQWEGMVDAARSLDVELVSYVGGVLSSPGYGDRANVLYSLAASARLDGLVVWSAAIGWQAPKSEMEALLARFGSTPLVSVEMRFPGRPSVLMDDYGGMRAVVDHIIEEHGRRRIAFIRGPSFHEGFEERYRAYLEGLEAHGIPFDPRLATPPSDAVDGVSALRVLLDEEGLCFDALVGANDLAALGALSVLEERGVRVPEDIAVAGFDNMPESLAASPPLSSADPPFAEMGRRALELVVDMIEGRAVPETQRMPIGTVRRRSCGCPDREERGEAEEPGDGALLELRARFVKSAIDGDAEGFLDAFERELEGATGSANSAAGLSLHRGFLCSVPTWTDELPLGARPRAGELVAEAQALAAEAIRRSIVRGQVLLAERNANVGALGERLGSVYDIDEQMDVLAKHLHRLGIAGCYVSLFARPGEPEGEARLVLACAGDGRMALPPEGLAFPSAELLPASIRPAPKGLSRLALALYFGADRFGFVVFEIASKEDAALCETLRWQLSWALKSAAVVREERAAAAAKATMLKELQHRVKNSMGLIAAIAGIESRAASNDETRAALASLEARIAAVGELYELLYASEGGGSVDLADYLARILDTASASIVEGPGRIAIDRSLEHCDMDLKRAVSLGLIVNELVTDSLKHAFPEGRTGMIRIRLLREGGSILLEVRDDGVGYPPGFDPEKAEGFGLQMVLLLSQQIGGLISFDSGEGGTAATLSLPEGEPR